MGCSLDTRSPGHRSGHPRASRAAAPVGLGAEDRVLCAGTLARTPLAERIPAAAQAGFQALSLFLDDLEAARAAGHSDADLRARLADHGLCVSELDVLLTWVPDVEGQAPPEGVGFFRWEEADFYAAAEVLGARSINAGLMAASEVPRDVLVESFAGLCDRAARRGLLVHVEFMPFSQIRGAAEALELVEAAGRPNGGVMFDVWHHFRGGGDPETTRRVAPRVFGVQLDDAPATPSDDLVEETLHHRLMPGDGDADVAGVIRALRAGGCRAPLGVEVFSDELGELPAAEVARRAADAVRRVVAKAREGG